MKSIFMIAFGLTYLQLSLQWPQEVWPQEVCIESQTMSKLSSQCLLSITTTWQKTWKSWVSKDKLKKQMNKEVEPILQLSQLLLAEYI